MQYIYGFQWLLNQSNQWFMIYWIEMFKTKRFKTIYGTWDPKNISRNTKYNNIVTCYQLNYLLQDITILARYHEPLSLLGCDIIFHVLRFTDIYIYIYMYIYIYISALQAAWNYWEFSQNSETHILLIFIIMVPRALASAGHLWATKRVDLHTDRYILTQFKW